MSESVRRTRAERVVRARGLFALALLVAAPDYWTYHVLSSHDLVVGVPILILSYVGFACVLWLGSIVALAVSVHRQEQSARHVPDRVVGHALAHATVEVGHDPSCGSD